MARTMTPAELQADTNRLIEERQRRWHEVRHFPPDEQTRRTFERLKARYAGTGYVLRCEELDEETGPL